MTPDGQRREIDSADPIYTPSQLHDALVPLIKAKLPVLVTGQPGQGKTDIITAVCQELDYDLVITHPVVDEPIDYKGFPFPYTDEDGKPKAAFVPFGEMEKLINAERPLVSFADDAGHAPKAVQAAYMQWILNRAINGQKMSDHVTFVAATNRKEDKAGVQGFLEPLKDRFVTIMELISSLEDWIEWAIKNKLPYEIISYVRYCPQILDEWEPRPDFSRTPTPRGIYGVARMLKAGIPKELRLKMISGAIGKERSTGFVGFLDIYNDLINPEEVIANPTKVKIPEPPGHKYALCGALAARANIDTIGPIITFANRFSDENEFADGETFDEFSVLLVRDAVNMDRIKLSKTREFIDWMDRHQDIVI
jgi:hypothetical protein